MKHDVEARLPGVERRGLHAVIERQPGHVDTVHPLVTKQALELGVLKARVSLVLRLAPGIDDGIDGAGVKPGVQLGSARVPHAVDRPWPALLLKGGMVGGVPVPGGDHERDLLHQLVDGTDHGVTVGNLERSSGAEVVLDVDDDQPVHVGPNIVRGWG